MTTEFIQTRSSQLKRKAPSDFKIITYESHKPKQKKQIIEAPVEEPQTKAQINEFNMKKSRYEVLKFGMSGFDPEKKEEAKIQLAIKLGAKPPKNKYKNYKQLQAERKQQQVEEKRRQDFQQLGKNQLGKSTAAKGKFFKKKTVKAGLLEKYGKASAKDVAKFNKSKK